MPFWCLCVITIETETNFGKMFKSFTKLSDLELQKLIKNNKSRSKAFETIFDRYSNYAIGFIRSLAKNEVMAQEIFQETFVRLYNQLLEKDDINIPGLITTIARNLFYNIKRDSKQIVDIDENEIEDNEFDLIEKKELLDLILNAVEFLEEKYRTVFILREFNGMSFKEIAEQENISFANAKLRSTRAKQKLIKILKPYILDLEKNIE